MFTREEKVLLLEAIRTKIERTTKDLENTKNEEIIAKKEKRIVTLLSCKAKILNSKEITQ